MVELKRFYLEAHTDTEDVSLDTFFPLLSPIHIFKVSLADLSISLFFNVGRFMKSHAFSDLALGLFSLSSQGVSNTRLLGMPELIV